MTTPDDEISREPICELYPPTVADIFDKIRAAAELTSTLRLHSANGSPLRRAYVAAFDNALTVADRIFLREIEAAFRGETILAFAS